MSYFFSAKNLVVGQEFRLEGDEVRHILSSRRMKVGEVLNLQDPGNNRFSSQVVKTEKSHLLVRVLQKLVTPKEPVVPLTLFQAVVAEKSLDFILQKGVELGLTKIQLFNSSNTATRLTKEIFQKKINRWNKILMEAAKQSDRAVWPTLEFSDGLEQAVQQAQKLDIVYLADISGQRISGNNNNPSSIGVFVGPEGGFDPAEVSRLKNLSNSQMMSLGPVILRAETAALAALAIIRNATL